MPIYEYQCGQCGHRFDHLARTAKDLAKKCPKCGATQPVKQFSTFSASVSDGSGGSACSMGACPSGTCSTGTCSTGTCPF